MGLYVDHILPRLLDFAMRRPHVAAERPRTLAAAYGDVLEIGFGTALNLPFYPTTVKTLTVLDRRLYLPRRVRRRMAEAPFAVELVVGNAERLTFDAGRFDCVVSTWTLCSIADVAAALAEVKRVLKPAGRFLFIEHGRSCQPRIARRQDRWNRWHRFVAGGCNLNRAIDELIRAGGMELVELERFLLPATPRILAPHYRGVARRLRDE